MLVAFIGVMRLTAIAITVSLLASCGGDEPAQPSDPEEIHIEIIGREEAEESPGLLPLVAEGERFTTMRELRAWMRRRSDPDRYPSHTMSDGKTPRPPAYIQGGIYHYYSRRALVIHCDGATLFGWIQGLIALAGRLEEAPDPWADCRESPFLTEFEILAEKPTQRLGSWIPYNFRGQPSGAPMILELVANERDRSSRRPTVRWALHEGPWDGAALCLGTARVSRAQESAGEVVFDDAEFPGQLVDRLRSGYFVEVKSAAEVPLAHVFAARTLVKQAGVEARIIFRPDDFLALVARLENGEIR